MEWVKFFGALTDRDEKADELFNEQVDIVNRIAKTDGTDTDDATKSDTVAFFLYHIKWTGSGAQKAQIMCQR